MSDVSTLVEEKSTHECPVFHFDFAKVRKHENADRLGLYSIPDSDYLYVLNLADWDGYVGKVCWVPPDSLVPVSRPEFSFLAVDSKYDEFSNKLKEGGFARVKAKRLRGIVSYGLMVKYTGELPDRANGATELEVRHYEPPSLGEGGKRGSNLGPSVDDASAPDGVYYKYDVDAFLKYGRRLFEDGEPVYVTVKYHGQNHRAVCKDGQMHVGSRTGWKKEFTCPPKITVQELIDKGVDPEKAEAIYKAKVENFTSKKAHWWQGFENTPGLRQLCEAIPGHCVYSEIINT